MTFHLSTFLKPTLVAACLALAATQVSARPSTTIVDAAVATPALSTLVAAVKAADLVGTLSSKGPFTVFAPTNAAFDKLPKGTVATLVKPANKKKLTKILTAHVVAGDVSASDLLKLIKSGGGHARLKTVSGDRLVASTKNGKIFIKDESGGMAQVATADLVQSNGVVHVVTSVLLPK
ncbi:MAG: fasciclin domain-containing protein [Hyphomicrobium aestuarii]|nr:fasciclin domain-containing protein [Hyphomicrobium aestuarii]